MSTTVLSLFLLLATGPGEKAARPADFIKQIETVDRMDRLRRVMELYREDHRSDPRSLQMLAGAFKMSEDATLDGWGRPFYYYTTGHSYVLASFGLSGTPKAQVAEPGGVAKQRDFDTNLVMIDGKWAQTPLDVDR